MLLQVFIIAALIVAVAAGDRYNRPAPYSGSYASEYKKDNYGAEVYEKKSYDTGYENNYGYNKEYVSFNTKFTTFFKTE